MKFIKTPVKGMCDMLPADMRLREHVLGMIKETYGACGFMQIETPVMEHIENLTSKQGGDNEKLIFKVMKRGAELQRALDKGDGELADNGLRYDLTVPLARYYANNKEKLPTPFKAMQLGNVWRADNPQKGRFRQFTQCDIDILGDDSSLAEIELITATATMLSKILAEANLNAFTIHINDRRMLAAAALTAGFEQEEIGGALISLDKFDKIGMDGIEKDLLESGYAPEKVEKYMAFYRSVRPGMEIADFCAGVNGEYLEARVGEALADIVGCVKPMLGEGVKIVFDPTLVRGMGYYTGPIFEVTLDGYNFAIAGGGRYELRLPESSKPIQGVGYAAGMERLIMVREALGLAPLPVEHPKIFLVSMGEQALAFNIALAAKLRKAGVMTGIELEVKSLKSQMRSADRVKAACTLVVGESELASGKANLKNMADSSQKEVALDAEAIVKELC